jgi:hypothetical protein
MLRRIDMVGSTPDLQHVADIYIAKNALDWQLDPSAALDIEARLQAYGFDQHALNMEVHVQAQQILSLFETLLNGAQLRRLLLLKEIRNLRHSERPRTTRDPRPNHINTPANGSRHGY